MANEKDINRVSSLREMTDNSRRASDGSTSNTLSSRAERRRSNSFNDLHPESVIIAAAHTQSTSSVAAAEERSADIAERIKMMQERAIARENETKMNRTNEQVNIQKSRVNALKANFEQIGTQSNLDLTQVEESPILSSRIQQLKSNLVGVVDMAAIEEKVSSNQQPQSPVIIQHKPQAIPFEQENIPMATLKEIGSKKLSLESINDVKVVDSLKGGWECKVCKTQHHDVPLFFFCACPDDYEELDGTEKSNRAKLSSDLCMIDKTSKYYIRGLLEIPLQIDNKSNSSELSNQNVMITWGIWVSIESSDFEKIVNNWNDNDPFEISGTLNNNIPKYNNTLGTPVLVTTRPCGFRPLITVKDKDSPLAKDAMDGIPISSLGNWIDFALHA